jgi:hypothetical protein
MKCLEFLCNEDKKDPCEEFGKSITVEKILKLVLDPEILKWMKRMEFTLELLCMNLNLAASDLCRTYEQNIAHKK